MKINLSKITTEARNLNTVNIDLVSTLEAVKMMNDENNCLVPVLKSIEDTLSECIDLVVATFKNNGRLIYIGAGTSGRMGVLDASECVPTFGVDKNMVVGVIAGGDYALRNAIENAEDNEEMAIEDLKVLNICDKDIVIGLSASGRTPYVKSALIYANKCNLKTVSISHSKNSSNSKYASLAIEAVCGPEILRGSTRLKAGTMTKLILNTITTISMIKIGKSYSNYMIDLKTTNNKLKVRGINMLMEITNCDELTAIKTLKLCDNKVKNAIICILMNVNYDQSKKLLEQNENTVRKVLKTVD